MVDGKLLAIIFHTQEKKIEFRWDFVQGMLKELSYQVSDLVSNKEL